MKSMENTLEDVWFLHFPNCSTVFKWFLSWMGMIPFRYSRSLCYWPLQNSFSFPLQNLVVYGAFSGYDIQAVRLSLYICYLRLILFSRSYCYFLRLKRVVRGGDKECNSFLGSYSEFEINSTSTSPWNDYVIT